MASIIAAEEQLICEVQSLIKPPPPLGKKDDRDAPGGTLGDMKGSGRSGGDEIAIEPDPVEPDYESDVWQAIHYAVKNADILGVFKCTDNGKAPHVVAARTSICQYTGWHVAVKLNKAKTLSIFVGIKAEGIDFEDVLGMTPLSLACSLAASSTMITYLLKANPGVNHVDKYSWTPLFWAAKLGSLETAKALLEKGAGKNYKDKRDQTPHGVATNEEIRDLLR